MPNFLVFLLLFLFVTITKANTTVSGISLNFGSTDTCPKVSLVLYSHSTHPGGNRNGYLNENNKGIGFRCYTRHTNWWYWTVSGIHNSQFGSTFVAGPGFHFPTLQLGLVEVQAGAELPYVYYESPRSRKTVYGLLPVPTVRLGMQLHDGWHVSYVQHHLADTKVVLYAVLLEHRF